MFARQLFSREFVPSDCFCLGPILTRGEFAVERSGNGCGITPRRRGNAARGAKAWGATWGGPRSWHYRTPTERQRNFLTRKYFDGHTPPGTHFSLGLLLFNIFSKKIQNRRGATKKWPQRTQFEELRDEPRSNGLAGVPSTSLPGAKPPAPDRLANARREKFPSAH